MQSSTHGNRCPTLGLGLWASRCLSPGPGFGLASRCEIRACARILGAILLLICLISDVHGQTRERRLSVGGMVGNSAGATLKLYMKPDSTDLGRKRVTAVSIDLSVHDGDYYAWSTHALTHIELRSSQLKVYFGPGTVFGSDDLTVFWGLSSAFGLFFDRSRFEVFMQATPRLIVLPETRAEFGSAVGLRYYL